MTIRMTFRTTGCREYLMMNERFPRLGADPLVERTVSRDQSVSMVVTEVVAFVTVVGGILVLAVYVIEVSQHLRSNWTQ